MSNLELWCGRTGTGKTTAILEEVVARSVTEPFGSPIWWIVPSGASYSTERMLLDKLPATVRVEVITLSRFAERILDATSVPTTRDGTPCEPMNDTAKRLLFGSVYAANQDGLSYFKRPNPSIAFLDTLIQALMDLKAYQISEQDVEAVVQRTTVSDGASKEMARMSASKLQDLWVLNRAFEQAVEQHNLWDTDHLYTLVQPMVTQFDGLQGAEVVFDGFAAWTPMEIDLVLAIAAVASRCVVTLSLDQGWLANEPANPFEEPYAPQTIRLWHDLNESCTRQNQAFRVRWFTRGHRFASQPPLQHVEACVFDFAASPLSGGEEYEPLRIVAAQNPRLEVTGTALQIERLVVEGTHSFGDIVVMVPSLSDYLNHIQDTFHSLCIPFMSDQFPGFMTHPLARFIDTVLCIAEYGLTTETASRMLMTEFPGLNRDEADWLLAYVRSNRLPEGLTWEPSMDVAFAVEQAAFDGLKVDRAQQDDERAKALMDRMFVQLTPFLSEVHSLDVTPARLASALWNLLTGVGARQTVARWMVNEDQSLTPLEASLHEQAWDDIIELLNDLSSVIQPASLPLDQACRVIRQRMSERFLSSIPGTVDSVLVTEAGRVDALTCRIAFVLGVYDGAFPKSVGPGGLWLDEERTCLESGLGRRFGVTDVQRQWDQRLGVYRALTRCTEQLWVSYPLANLEGKAQRPAHIVEHLKRILPDHHQELLWTLDFEGAGSPDLVRWSKESALMWIAAEAHRSSSSEDPSSLERFVRTIKQWLSTDPVYAKRLERVLQGGVHRPLAAPLSNELAKALYGGPKLVSVSQLETFAACPFQHFSRYGLRISDDLSDGAHLRAARGTLIHSVLQRFIEAQLADVDGWKRMTPDEAVEAMHQVHWQTVRSKAFASWYRSRVKERVMQGALDTLAQAAKVLTEHAQHSLFEPKLLEFAFDRSDPWAEALNIQLEDGVTLGLRGRIDRVDVVEHPDRHAFRIIDYKSSQLKLDLTRVWHGLQLQLPVYAAVMESLSPHIFGRQSEAAGVLYLPLQRKVSPVNAPSANAAAEAALVKQMRARGLMVQDRDVVGWMDDRLVGTGESPLFPKVYTKEGEVAKYAPVVSRRAWRGLLAHAMKSTKGMASAIQSGTIDVSPYRLPSGENACQHCSLSSLCHIQPRIDYASYRRLNGSAAFDEEVQP